MLQAPITARDQKSAQGEKGGNHESGERKPQAFSIMVFRFLSVARYKRVIRYDGNGQKKAEIIESAWPIPAFGHFPRQCFFKAEKLSHADLLIAGPILRYGR